MRSNWFLSCSMAVILLNAVWIGIDAELNTPSRPVQWFRVVDQVFCVLFTAELCVHFGAFDPKLDCLKDRWFCFDLVLVVVMILDAGVLPLALLMVGDEKAASGFYKLGALRVIRLLRLSWLSRVLTHFPELMMLSKGILQAMRSVFFTLLMLLLLLFCFGVVFKTQVAEDTELEAMFGTILGSMWVLLLHGTFLDSPARVLNTIGGESAALAGFFLAFIFLSSFTVLNMLIGIVCEVVSQVSWEEKEAAALASLSSSLLEILECYDARNDKHIRPHEFDLLFRNPDLHRVLRRFGVDADALLALKDHVFEVNNKKVPFCDIPDDIDNFLSGVSNGTFSWASSSPTATEQDISFSDFLEVVMRLRGDNKATVTDIVELREYFGQRFTNVDRILSAIIQLPAAQQQPGRGCLEDAREETTEPAPQLTVQQQLAAIAAQVSAIGTHVEGLSQGLAHMGSRVDTITGQLEN